MTENTPAPESDGATPNNKKKIGIAVGAVLAIGAIVTAAALAVGGGDDDAPATAEEPTTSAEATSEASAEETTEADVVAGSGAVHQDEVLVTTDWLEENLDDPNLVIIEVSENRPNSGLTSYEEGHIPGAVEFVWTEHFIQQVTRDLHPGEDFTEIAQAAGVNDDSTIILYGDANNWFAAWGAWAFKYHGAGDVRLLDGGRVKWEAEGRPLDNVAPTPATGDFEAGPGNTDIRALRDEVLEIAIAPTVDAAPADLVDIRGPAEFNGEIGVAEGFPGEAAVKWGHIPNAVNVPWATIVDEDGAYLPAEEIREIYAELGVDGSKPVVVYCRIGERASHTWYALSQILGYDVALYDGSWTEWGNSVGVPIQNNTPGNRTGLWS